MSKYPEDRNNYWKNREKALIYSYTKDMAKHYAPWAKSAIDVGCFISPVICELDWIEHRFSNDISEIKEWDSVDDVMFLQGDFRNIDAKALVDTPKFDLVISHQTIEHIDDAQGFAQSLCAQGRRVICSTSYEVEYGLVPGHVQDPISLDKFTSWFLPRKPLSILIERTGDDRFASILGVF